MAVVSFLLLAGVILATVLQSRPWTREQQAPELVPIPVPIDSKR